MTATLGRAGMLTTVQDGGRHGAQHLGVPVAGPMDWWSFEAANRLAGNPPGCAALEVTLIGPELEFGREAIASVVGAHFEFTVSGRPGVMNAPMVVAAGARLSFGERAAGARAYLAVDGGFAVTPVMGSRATHLTAAMGGMERRALRRGDVVPLGPSRKRGGQGGVRRPSPLTTPHLPLSMPAVLRAIPGPEPAPAAFWETAFRISAQSNRMGYRLDGPPMDAPGDHLSSAVAMGTVQATPSGTCVLLMADRATSGGYARVATVITADLPIAGQLAPGDRIRFASVTLAEARAALASMRAALPDLAS